MVAYRQLGARIRRAIKAGRKADGELTETFARTNPQNFHTWKLLGEYYLSQGDDERAAQSFGKALEAGVPRRDELLAIERLQIGMQAMIRNPEIQFASADAIAAFQEERLRDEVAYLYENSPYYRRMFDGCGMQPGDIRTADDLRHLPVTTKTDLQLHPGEFVCVPRNRIIDYVTTSGTLGDPGDVRPHGRRPGPGLAYNEAMSFTTAGCTGEDILQLMTTIDRRFMAGWLTSWEPGSWDAA